ncbi:MAG TPA: DnaD domain protein [Thermomicrobiales bacterium]|nr:DnaD domain protein [Thermomicrobiales bacterium]
MTPEPATPPDNHLPAEFLLRLVRDVWNPLETKMVLAVAALGGTSKPVPEAELIADPDVLVGMRADGSNRSPADRAAEALDAAVTRGVLIALGLEGEGRWYVLATEANRRKAHAGGFTVPDVPRPTPLPIERPGVYALYEQNIGLLTPLIADRLADALHRYPETWIVDAIGEAVAYNRRSWRYIERILQNWATEGRSDEAHRRDHEADHAPRKTIADQYEEFLRRRG